jgi:hypothetical protein
MSAIKVGDLVWSPQTSWLRLGIVKSARIDDKGWAQYSVDWQQEEIYTEREEAYKAINPNYRTNNTNHAPDRAEFRAGQIYVVDPERLTKIMELYRKDIA